VPQIHNTGEHFTFEFDAESVIVLRTTMGEVKAHMNVCHHRGSKICLEQSGSHQSLTCPYHARRYNLYRNLIYARYIFDDF
jgi:phenylpropionate dioxygenase-like ring-hydroxylating dioxygenase large terminal subunit